MEERMPISLQPLPIPGFRVIDLTEEFLNHSRVEIERLHNTESDFNDDLYQQAVDLVLRKLQHSATGDAQ
jgi:hypothetical protein